MELSPISGLYLASLKLSEKECADQSLVSRMTNQFLLMEHVLLRMSPPVHFSKKLSTLLKERPSVTAGRDFPAQTPNSPPTSHATETTPRVLVRRTGSGYKASVGGGEDVERGKLSGVMESVMTLTLVRPGTSVWPVMREF